jgi:hypothetical protein
MKKLSETYKELGIAFSFPIRIEDAKGNETYYEKSNGVWCKTEYNANGDRTYYEKSNGFWWKCEYDRKGNLTHYKTSDGYKKGTPQSQSCDGKVVEVDGKKYKLTEL